MLLCLRGTPVLYQGDEIGLGDVPRAAGGPPRPARASRYWPAYAGRDAMRTPMPWRDAPGGGLHRTRTQTLAAPGARLEECNVEQQRSDPGSMLTLARDLIALRRRTPDLKSGSYETLAAPEGVWAWRRGDGVAVALNMSDDERHSRRACGAASSSAPIGNATVSPFVTS